MNMQRLIWLYCLIFLATGCSNWLDVKPYDQISEEELVTSEEGFQKLLNGIYIGLNDEALYGLSLTIEMIEIMGGAYEIGDQSLVWGNYPDLKTYNYNTEFWRNRMNSTWDKAYALILNCNKLLENMRSREELFTGNNYNIIQGEALALRAMLHFDMLRLFGPVYSQKPESISIPYYTTEVLSPEPLLPASEVMAKIIQDLQEARILLNEDPVKTEGGLASGNINESSNFLRYRALRLNYYAVTGLLARVCLYAGQQKNAFNYATEVIKASNNGIFPFVDKSLVNGTAKNPDRIFSSEVLFALSNSQRGKLFEEYFDPSLASNMVFRMETDLLEKTIFGGVENGGNLDDYRCRSNWISSGSARYFYKYSDMTESGRIENTMIPLLRVGEMYLIAAESQSEILADGVSYVNTLRKNRGVSNLQTLTSTLLQYEYIRELYGEGQLFFMYKRMYSSIIWSYTSTNNPAPSNAIFVVPLPDTETENR